MYILFYFSTLMLTQIAGMKPMVTVARNLPI